MNKHTISFQCTWQPRVYPSGQKSIWEAEGERSERIQKCLAAGNLEQTEEFETHNRKSDEACNFLNDSQQMLYKIFLMLIVLNIEFMTLL